MRYLKKISSNHIFAFLANFFECGRLLIGWHSAESTNQKPPTFKKVCQNMFWWIFWNYLTYRPNSKLLILFTLFYPHRYTDLTWIKDVHTRLKCNPPNYLLICDSLWVIPLEFFNQQCSFPIYSPLFSLISSNVSNFCHLVLVSGQLDVKKVSVVRILFGISKLTRLHFKHVCTPFIQVRSV